MRGSFASCWGLRSYLRDPRGTLAGPSRDPRSIPGAIVFTTRTLPALSFWPLSPIGPSRKGCTGLHFGHFWPLCEKLTAPVAIRLERNSSKARLGTDKSPFCHPPEGKSPFWGHFGAAFRLFRGLQRRNLTTSQQETTAQPGDLTTSQQETKGQTGNLQGPAECA